MMTEDYARPSPMAELLSQGSSSFGHLPAEKGHTQRYRYVTHKLSKPKLGNL